MNRLFLLGLPALVIFCGCGPSLESSELQLDLPSKIHSLDKNPHMCNEDLQRFLRMGELYGLDVYDEWGDPANFDGVSKEEIRNAIDSFYHDTLNGTPGSSGHIGPQFVVLPELSRLKSLIREVIPGATVYIKVRINFPPSFSAAKRSQYEELIQIAFESWSEPMNSIFPGTRIRAVFGSGTPKLVVNVKDEEGRSNYWPYIPIVSEIPQINWKLKGDVHSSATMLHELGHALGLGDAYIEGVWSCKEGQPYISVMCNDSQITADDIRGIQWLLCRHTGRCNEHNYLDMYGGDGGAFKISECMELGTDGIFHQGLVQSVSVKWGGYVDSIGITCRDTFTGELYSLTRMGGAGGVYSRTFSCQGSAYLTGAKLRTGSLVDSIELLCSDGTTSGRMGGNGGTLWEYRCPAEYPYLKGIRTRSGNYVDKIGLTCANRLGYYSEPEFLEDTPPEPPQLPADPKKPIPEFPIPAPPQPENPLPAPIEPKVPYYTVVNKRNLAMLGGPGGNSAKIECKPTREGPAIRSIYVRWGTLIDFIKITCADGSTKSFGGPGGSFQKTVALENKMGSLKSLGILHKSGQFFLGPSYSALAELKVGSYSDTVAFTGRGISATQQCSASEHLIGFNVRSGGYIDAIGGICATVR